MARASSGSRYRGFAVLERDSLRREVDPNFDWVSYASPSPRNPLLVPLTEARVALVSTAGACLPGQARFSLGNEGDPSYRVIPADAESLRFAHAGYDTRFAYRDPDIVFPLPLLRTLAAEREIGALARRAFSFMGYIPETGLLLYESGPAVARELLADAADLVLLVPA